MKPQPLVSIFVVAMLVGLPAAFVRSVRYGASLSSAEVPVQGRHELNS